MSDSSNEGLRKARVKVKVGPLDVSLEASEQLSAAQEGPIIVSSLCQRHTNDGKTIAGCINSAQVSARSFAFGCRAN